MLDHVDVGPRSLGAYTHIIGKEVVEEIRELAAPLRGARIAHINATTYGGGVSELLRSIVPLYRGLGIQADWKLISARPEFFNVTKDVHNALQGGSCKLTGAARETYLMYNTRNAQLLDEQYDFIVVHDPQPAAIRHFRGPAGAKWIWRCHIDTSEPNETVLEFLLPFVAEYDALVFTMDAFVPPRLEHQRVVTMTPAIDPLSPKNVGLSEGICQEIRAWRGIDPRQPLVTQVSRFDPWKDPLGVIQVYRMVREEVPGLQLALLSSMASDDPEVWEIYSEIIAATQGDDDIHVLTNLIGVGDMEVCAFQTSSDVVIQKSIREGFGLVVSETMWKGTPVVANRSGGIPIQMEDGAGGFLVDDTEQCAERVLFLLRNREEARKRGLAGRERVRQRFLITRLLADELRLLASLPQEAESPAAPASPTSVAAGSLLVSSD
ncbi:MAG: glycosyltransferase [Dehalococcoidia bacterium]|nr:MAG: glycosyltransferase [Dehalococcoidia bacterium]